MAPPAIYHPAQWRLPLLPNNPHRNLFGGGFIFGLVPLGDFGAPLGTGLALAVADLLALAVPSIAAAVPAAALAALAVPAATAATLAALVTTEQNLPEVPGDGLQVHEVAKTPTAANVLDRKSVV